MMMRENLVEVQANVFVPTRFEHLVKNRQNHVGVVSNLA